MVEHSLADAWLGIAVLFCAFLLFLLASIGIGAALRRRFFSPARPLVELGDAFLFGSLFLFAAAFLLASLHLLRVLPGWLFGLAFLPSLWGLRGLLAAVLNRTRLIHWSLLLVCFLVLLVRTLTAALPQGHGDPLLYHLLGPKLWVDAGGFLMHQNLPNALLASSWECLYIWPQIFWATAKPLFGLVEAQIFSQWIHLYFAWLGCALLVMRAFRHLVPAKFLPLVGLASLFVSGVQWTGALAKNDAGIAFWSLGAVLYLWEALQERCSRKALIGGLLTGLAVSGKITALLTVVPIVGVLFLAEFSWRECRYFLKFSVLAIVGGLAGLLPIYARNFNLSGNPLFPLFAQYFPGPWMSHTWGAHFAQVQPASPWRSLPNILLRFPELLRESPLILIALAVPICFLPSFRRNRGESLDFGVASLVIGAFAAYLIFVTTQVREIELRYLGGSLMILAGAGAALPIFFANVLGSMRLRNVAVGLLLVGLLASSKLPIHILWKIWRSPLGTAHVRTHTAGEAKAWLRAHAEGGLVVVVADNETYYLSPVPVTVLTERPDLDDVTYAETNAKEMIRKICEISHARFLLDARLGAGFWQRFGEDVMRPALVFSAQNANVYDLRVLEERLLPGAKLCR